MRKSINMIEFGDTTYYFDLEAFDKAITMVSGNEGLTTTETEETVTYGSQNEITEKVILTKTFRRSKEIDATKYDLLKSFVDYIMDYEDVSDDTLGTDRALEQAPLGFKMTFNTLLSMGIIKEL